ncbi:Uncharacterised protein [Mycobacteroides abscessus subsp. abscessus]|nr:Uncharacterised protein [Mycobacteroides abscessus subsp. abscessus]
MMPARKASGTETRAGLSRGNQAKSTSAPSIEVRDPEMAGEKTIRTTELTSPV